MALVFRPTFGAAVSYAADITAPTYVSSAIDATGEVLTDTYNEPLNATVTTTTGRSITMSGGACTLSSPVVTGSTVAWTISRVIYSGETCSANSYTQPGTGIKDSAGNYAATWDDADGSQVANDSAEASLTLFAQNSSSTSGSYSVDGNSKQGPCQYNPGSSITVKRVTFTLTAQGTISGKTLTCQIWNTNGTNLTTMIEESAGVTGNNSWSETVVPFDFTGAAMTNTANQAILLFMSGGLDATNYVRNRYTAAGGFGGSYGFFGLDGTRASTSTLDAKIAIYV
jgi:hypothetical protein